MKVQEKPVRKPLMFLDMLSAFEDVGKMAPKIVHLTVMETSAERGQNLFHLQVYISVGKL